MASTTSSFLVILALVLSFVALPCISACPTCSSPAAPSTPVAVAHCPLNALKLGVCADVLGLIQVVLGEPPSGSKCCVLLKGLVDLEAAACLCTVLKANLLGINLDVPIALSVLLSACQKTVPPGFTCP